MTLQRFQNFQFGALDASRLNQLVDAVMRLEQRVEQVTRQYEPTKDVILARITGTGTQAAFDACQRAVRAVSYPFEEVGLGIQKEGAIKSDTCIETYAIEGGLSDTNGAFLLMMESEPSLEVGAVVKAHLASRSDYATAVDKGMVYIATPISAPSAVVTGIVTSGPGAGSEYTVRIDGTGDRITVQNLYESEVYYGALDEQPECASLSPLPIPDGSRIWAFRYRTEWYTCVPTPFSVTCLCNDDTTGPGAARALASIESKAASAMLRIAERLI